jgi:hypothetical protein
LRRPLRAGFPPLLSDAARLKGQLPTEPIRQRQGTPRGPPTTAGNLRTASTLGSRFREGRRRVTPYRWRGRSLRACSKGRDNLKSARYGTVDRSGWNPPAAAFQLLPSGFPLSSRRSSDQMGGVGRQVWARGPIPIFRKIHLYGKSVKSTHGHTKKKPN